MVSANDEKKHIWRLTHHRYFGSVASVRQLYKTFRRRHHVIHIADFLTNLFASCVCATNLRSYWIFFWLHSTCWPRYSDPFCLSQAIASFGLEIHWTEMNWFFNCEKIFKATLKLTQESLHHQRQLSRNLAFMTEAITRNFSLFLWLLEVNLDLVVVFMRVRYRFCAGMKNLEGVAWHKPEIT